MADSDSVTVRLATSGDVSFIFATWLRGLRYGNELFELIESEIYYDCYHQVIQKILTSPGTLVWVACLSGEPDVILGYSVFSGPVLHWCHVKAAWRNIGIAKRLVPSGVTTATHLTKLGAAILKNHPAVKFNPFATPQ